MDGADLQSAQGLDHEIGTNGGEARRNGFGGVIRCDGELLLHQDVSGVEAGINAHGGDTGDSFALCNRPLDRGGAAIFWQERSMQIDVAESGEIEHPLWNDAAVTDDDNGVGLERGELRMEFLVGFDAVGLDDWKTQLECWLLDGRADQ